MQKCVIDTVQSILNPSANNKNYDQTVEEYDALRKLAHRLGIAIDCCASLQEDFRRCHSATREGYR